MKNRANIFYSLILGLLVFFLINCDFSPYQGTATVALDLGVFASGGSERGMNIPSNLDIDSFTITISGPGISTVSRTYPYGTRYIYLAVPAGADRTIMLEMHVDPDNPSAILTFGGNDTVDLRPGQFTKLILNMMPYETKIIFPNPDTDGGDHKIVQLDSFHDSSPRELTEADVIVGTFVPWDIDFDSRGNIYVANYFDDDDYVIRFDNLITPNETQITPNTGLTNGIRAVAIDKIKNYLYYVNDDDELYRVDLSTASFPEQGTAIDISDISGTATIIAMAVDEEGMLYIADAGDTGVDGDDSFIKFNPNTEQVIKSYSTNIDFRQGEIPVNLGSIQNLSDIIISYGYVYLLNFGVTNGNLILKFNTDLELIDGYGTKAPDLATDTARGHFYGPHIFAGLRKDKFYILDEMGSQQMGLGYDKLISMDDMDGNNWDYNDSFPFFYDC